MKLLPKTAELWRRLLAIFALVAVLLGSGLSMSMAADESKEGLDSSLYTLSSNVSNFFDVAVSPQGNEKCGSEDKSTCADFFKSGADGDKGWSMMTEHASDAGGVLGYVDPEKSSLGSWIRSQVSGASSSRSHTSLADLYKDADSSRGGKFTGLIDYVHYGSALNSLGLDNSSSSGGMSFSLADVGGGIILLLFLMAYVVELMAALSLKVMQALNPFGVLVGSFTDYADSLPDSNAWGSFAKFMADLMNALINMSWTLVVPMMFATLFMVLLFGRDSGKKRHTALNMVRRLLFLGLGIPLLAVTYTGSINAMSTMNNVGSSPAQQVVLSNYVDFEGWILENRLAVPEGAIIEWDASKATASGASKNALRQTAYQINASLPTYAAAGIQADGLGTGSTYSERVSNGTVADTQEAFGTIFSLLDRYMGGNHINASDFESGVKSSLSSVYSNPNTSEEKKKEIANYFSAFSDATKYGDLGTKSENEPGGYVSDNPLLTNASQTGLRGTVKDGASRTEGVTAFSTARGGAWLTRAGTMVLNSNGERVNTNLTPLATYNYLNTRFDPNSTTLYSAEKSTSGLVRESHNAVSQIGSGPMKFIYWLQSATTLSTFAVIGIFFIAMLVNSIRRSVELISSAPFAMLGALAAMSKVIVITFALLIEILGTVFIYLLFTEIIKAIPSMIEAPLIAFASGEGGAFFQAIASAGMMPYISSLISIGVIWWIIIISFKTRRSLLKGTDEATTSIVNRFMGTKVDVGGAGGPVGGSALGAVVGGAATGAGMAAMSKMMNKNGDNNSTQNNAGDKNAAYNPGGAITEGGDTNSSSPGGSPQDGSDGSSVQGGEVSTDAPQIDRTDEQARERAAAAMGESSPAVAQGQGLKPVNEDAEKAGLTAAGAAGIDQKKRESSQDGSATAHQDGEHKKGSAKRLSSATSGDANRAAALGFAQKKVGESTDATGAKKLTAATDAFGANTQGDSETQVEAQGADVQSTAAKSLDSTVTAAAKSAQAKSLSTTVDSAQVGAIGTQEGETTEVQAADQQKMPSVPVAGVAGATPASRKEARAAQGGKNLTSENAAKTATQSLKGATGAKSVADTTAKTLGAASAQTSASLAETTGTAPASRKEARAAQGGKNLTPGNAAKAATQSLKGVTGAQTSAVDATAKTLGVAANAQATAASAQVGASLAAASGAAAVGVNAVNVAGKAAEKSLGAVGTAGSKVTGSTQGQKTPMTQESTLDQVVSTGAAAPAVAGLAATTAAAVATPVTGRAARRANNGEPLTTRRSGSISGTQRVVDAPQSPQTSAKNALGAGVVTGATAKTGSVTGASAQGISATSAQGVSATERTAGTAVPTKVQTQGSKTNSVASEAFKGGLVAGAAHVAANTESKVAGGVASAVTMAASNSAGASGSTRGSTRKVVKQVVDSASPAAQGSTSETITEVVTSTSRREARANNAQQPLSTSRLSRTERRAARIKGQKPKVATEHMSSLDEDFDDLLTGQPKDTEE